MIGTREMLIERVDGMDARLTARLDGVDSRLERIEVQLKVLTQDVMQVRTDQQRLEDRMDAIERRPN